MGNQPYNQSMYDNMMDNFKNNVRAVHDALVNYESYWRVPMNTTLSEREKKILARFEQEFKAECIEIYNDVIKHVTMISEANKRLDLFLKYRYFRPIWLTDDDGLPLFNSGHVEFDELEFSYMEERQDELMCEMAETKGMGYDAFAEFQVVNLENAEDCDPCDDRRYEAFIHRLQNFRPCSRKTNRKFSYRPQNDVANEDEDLPF